MPNADLLARLIEAQGVVGDRPLFDHLGGGVPILGFSPEAVARGLEAGIVVALPLRGYDDTASPTQQQVDEQFNAAQIVLRNAMLDAFLAAAGRVEGRER